MLIAVIGENCVGKSTLVNKLNQKLKAKVYSGKDYLRLEKNPDLALSTFKTILNNSVKGDNIIYIISEKEHLLLLPVGCIKIVLSAQLELIKERFKMRLNGSLPFAVEKMLESKHGMFDDLECDIKLDENYNINEVLDKLNL